MPERTRLRTPTTSMQLLLLPSAGQIVVLDRKRRQAVVDVLARLILEAAGADKAREEVRDDPA